MKTTHRNYSEENGDFTRLARFFMTVGGTPRLFDLVPGQGRGLKIRVVRKQARLRLGLRGERSPVVRRIGELIGFAISEGGDRLVWTLNSRR